MKQRRKNTNKGKKEGKTAKCSEKKPQNTLKMAPIPSKGQNYPWVHDSKSKAV